ncbi:MAG: Phosphoglycerate kinase [Deltaproteobacteria bacterium ADurb.Bin151]|jgi:phosphoglycerate kinase|nr:phosphoglycerate kinase [Smithella sp.]OQB57289.1 MAG: Phosphoglycerate kinase [Deltaproteobacteria bacterium ADurb.Bin151]HNZ09799.1 phosphoglycerate kinase [Smithellaceae bacterium]HOG81265.1 phosphoglycerate kinase [Smithellaceae bacterium]HOQ40505.1 phosphoglycerate kinase [Smithellaceae bacterium]
MKYLDQIDVSGKKVLVRVDFNVPMDKSGNVTDVTRVKASLATINFIRDKGARVIVTSHLGRPKGKRVEEFSLRPVAPVLAGMLKTDVPFIDDCIGEKAEKAVTAMKAGDLILLENLRFHPGEDKNDEAFAQELAKLCDVYVNDAFAVSHRAAASNTAITKYVPVCAAGFLLKNEIEYFNKAMGNPTRPLVAIIGGAKVSDKIKVLENVIDKVDRLIVGGGMAFTFLKAQGFNVGKSLCETDMLDLARKIMDKAKAQNVQFLLPVDTVIAQEPSADAERNIVAVKDIPDGWMGLDIGPASIAAFSDAVKTAKTIVWNGPLGMFELAPFSSGTFKLVDAVVQSGAMTIVGGGDTDTAVHKTGKSDKISYISTGGGAFLELLEGKTLPAVAALG